MAAQEGHDKVVELLLDKRAKVDAKNKENGTPLHLAASKGHDKVVELLLDKGAKVDAKNKENGTPLHLAASRGHDKVVELLLEHGADVNVKTSEGFTALALALKNGHSEVVDLLLADPNINVDCVDLKIVCKEGVDKRKLIVKRIQDHKLFDKVKEAAEIDENKIDTLLKEIEELLELKTEYSFKPSLNYSPGGNDKNTTLKIAIKAGGKLLQLLYDYAEENIGVDTKIFKQLKDAKEQQENSQPKSDLSDVSVSNHLTQFKACN